MSDTDSMTMRATFYGGPCDGGELDLVEPVRQGIVFPLAATTAAVILAPVQRGEGAGAWLNQVPGRTHAYRLRMTPDQRVVRDALRRVIYDHVRVTTTPPKETPAP